MKKTLDHAAPLIREHEGLRLKAYTCPAGKWTIGYGHTGAGVTAGTTITKERAERLLAADMQDALKAVRALVVVPLTVTQEAALVDFVFNLGATRLRNSTLLRTINAGDPKDVPVQFRRWVYAKSNGKTQRLPGLVKRRDAECALWATPSEAA